MLKWSIGIEYGVMQLIAETYHLLKLGLGLNNDDLSLIFDRWNQTELKTYFGQEDKGGGGRLIDKILDQAGQKGTGMWAGRLPYPMDDGIRRPRVG